MESYNTKFLNVIHETACAELGSALEMIAACKSSDEEKLAYGYFEHSKDEYNHTSIFLSILSKAGQKLPSLIARRFRLNANSLVTKGYVSSNGYLIEIMPLKDFIAYVYTNELLAKESFEKILKLVKNDKNDSSLIKLIMNDELRHHGLAEKYFLKHYPRLQPWQLRMYRTREGIKNRSRKFYDKNLKFLDKVLTPLYFLMAYIASKIILLIDLKEFKREGKNLMGINPKSII